ncbi:MAG: hypothetical protein E6K78_08920 [Candidatus Eisenbacteria bacterium]|uniref:Uncharacterized protein n=1 Tax=Eiseniibacteriota bacterium TaxID=2212470 RepID=A0A538TLS8_UNCEI|nr:MAG: hypothetical protein E6K78_08920 [Candidatus Eisenbacteria bacterium]
MTVDPGPSPGVGRLTRADILLDGLFAGMIGALAVACWFFLLDVIGGRPLYTPALLGTVLLNGGTAITETAKVAPLEIAAYTAFHFLAFLAVGLLFSYLMALFEQFPIVGFVLLVLFLSLQLGFFVLDLALGAQLMGALRPWTVVVANLLAASTMAWYLWRRHPRIKETLRHVWDQQ